MNSAEERLKEASKLNDLRRYNEVVELLSDENLNSDANLWAEKAFAYCQLSKYVNSTACIEEALKIDSFHPRALLCQGHVFFVHKNYEKAILSYEKGLSIESNYKKNLFFALGNIYVRLKDLIKALDYYQKALVIDPNLIEAYLAIGNIWGMKVVFSGMI